MPLIIGKCRPRRVFKDETGKFYILCNGVRKYLKPIKRKGKTLTSLTDVQREVRQKVKGQIKINYVPQRKDRDWRKQNKKSPQIHRPKNDLGIADIVNAIHHIGKPEAYDPSVFNQNAAAISLIPEKKEEKNIKPILGPTGEPLLTINEEDIDKRKPGRKAGTPNKAKLIELENLKEPPPAYTPGIRRTSDADAQGARNIFERVFGSLRKKKDTDADARKLEFENELDPLEIPDNVDAQEADDDLEDDDLISKSLNDEKDEKKAENEPNPRRRNWRAPAEGPNFEQHNLRPRRQGHGKLLKALWNDQIEEYFNNEPRFTGTYSIDEIKDIPKRIPQAFVINTAPSDADEGEHWQAVYISPDSVEFYDSYGDEPDKQVVKQLKEKVHSWKLPVMLKFKVNKVAGQKDTTNTCGFFSMRFLDERLNGVPFNQATRFERPENEHDRVTHEEETGEKTINKEFKLI